MLTVGLLLIPTLFIALVLMVKEHQSRMVALLGTLLTFGLNMVAVVQFEITAEPQFALSYEWIRSLGISFDLGIDGISMLMVLLTNFLMPLIILSTWNRSIKNLRAYLALLLLTQAAFIGVFVARDMFVFYIFWELTLIPMYFISLYWGKEKRIPVTFKFFLYTLAGSLVMLLAIIYVYIKSPYQNFSIETFYQAGEFLSRSEQYWVFWALFLGFAIKVPLFPVHGWLPDTHTEAPTQGTLLLAGIMLKMGIYGLIRWVLPVTPLAVETFSTVVILLSCAGIVYASCIAIVQKDLKRLIAFSSIGHLGLTTAGMFAMNMQGVQGAILQAVNHGITSVGLFFVADIVYERLHTRDLDRLGGIAHRAQSFAILFMIMLLGSVALPATNGFVGEFLLFVGLYQYSPGFTALAGLGIILGAVYMLRAYQKTMLGPAQVQNDDFADTRIPEKLVLIPLAIVVFAIGLYPMPLLEMAEPAVNEIVKIYGSGN
jgi:NADH-quinone oxidoreductase subunit M